MKQAHYGVYRGAVHVELHQVLAAQRWIGCATEMRDRYPSLIVGEHAGVLDTAIARLNQQAAPAVH